MKRIFGNWEANICNHLLQELQHMNELINMEVVWRRHCKTAIRRTTSQALELQIKNIFAFRGLPRIEMPLYCGSLQISCFFWNHQTGTEADV